MAKITTHTKAWCLPFTKGSLEFCMKRAWLTVVVMILGLAASIYGFTFVKQSFFPSSTTPMFQADIWLPEGTDIRATNTKLKALESWLSDQEGVEHITTTAGKGLQRFMLTYAPEKSYAAYGEITTRVTNYEQLATLMSNFRGAWSKTSLKLTTSSSKLNLAQAAAQKLKRA